MKRPLAVLTLAAAALVPAGQASAQLIYNPPPLTSTGGGLGTVLTVLTVATPNGQTSSEGGCISPTGPAAVGTIDPICGFLNSVVQSGASQSLVRYLTGAGAEASLVGLTGQDLRVVVNFSEPGGSGASLDNLELFLYKGNSVAYRTSATGVFTGQVFDPTGTGTGSYGFVYMLSDPSVLAFNSALASTAGTGDYSIGLGASVTQADGGHETFSITRVTATPEPASLTLLGTGLLGIAGAVRRRRRSA